MMRHFVSYPKSGRTWIRYILVQLGVDDQILFHHDGFEFNDGSLPPHNFDLSQRLEKYARVEKLVYLERDPRDVMVSLYFQITGRFKDFFGYKGSLSEFIRDDYFGAGNLRHFRAMWKEFTDKQQFLTISYEECHRDTVKTLDKILNYYGFKIDAPQLVDAIKNADFSRMKQLEESGSFPHPWLQPRQGSPKVRQGKVGGFRDVLNADDIRYLDDIYFSDR